MSHVTSVSYTHLDVYKRQDFKIAIDAASSEWAQEDGTYLLPKSGIKKTTDELIEFWEGIIDRYPIFSIEDPLGENDYEGFARLTEDVYKRQDV